MFIIILYLVYVFYKDYQSLFCNCVFVTGPRDAAVIAEQQLQSLFTAVAMPMPHDIKA